MKNIIITFALFFMMTTSAVAAELIMFSMASCGYCQNFLKEVAPTYAESNFAKLLPLRIISMDRKKAPKWYDKAYNAKKIDGIAGTPTFVVFDNGEEKARLIGYQGKERFYEDMTNFIESNRESLQSTAGLNPIPYEPDTEMNYKEANQETKKHEGKNTQDVPRQRSPLTPFLVPDLYTPHKDKKLPNGVINSSNMMDHQYKTRAEAEIAAMWLGCRGIHHHEMPDGDGIIWMPCELMKLDNMR